MYRIDILKNNNWVEFYENDDIKIIDKVVYKLINLKNDKMIRILKDDILLCWINGTEYDYWYWKNRYVRDKGINFDYTSSYYNYQKKKGSKK